MVKTELKKHLPFLLAVVYGVFCAAVLVKYVANSVGDQTDAHATYSDGSSQNLTGPVTWTSSNTSVATIDSTGLVSRIAAGSATIQATLGSVSGSTSQTTAAAVAGGIDRNATTNGACNFPDSSCTLFPSSGPARNETVMVYAWWAGQSLTATVSDGVNTYMSIAGPIDVPGTAIRAQEWYAVNRAGPTKFTVKLSGPSANGAFNGIVAQVISITGLDPINPLDTATVATATGTGTRLVVTPGGPAFQSEMIWGIFMAPFPVTPWTQGTGWTNVTGQEAVSVGLYQNISSGGAQSPNVTSSSSKNWVGFAVGFKNRTAD